MPSSSIKKTTKVLVNTRKCFEIKPACQVASYIHIILVGNPERKLGKSIRSLFVSQRKKNILTHLQACKSFVRPPDYSGTQVRFTHVPTHRRFPPKRFSGPGFSLSFSLLLFGLLTPEIVHRDQTGFAWYPMDHWPTAWVFPAYGGRPIHETDTSWVPYW